MAPVPAASTVLVRRPRAHTTPTHTVSCPRPVFWDSVLILTVCTTGIQRTYSGCPPPPPPCLRAPDTLVCSANAEAFPQRRGPTVANLRAGAGPGETTTPCVKAACCARAKNLGAAGQCLQCHSEPHPRVHWHCVWRRLHALRVAINMCCPRHAAHAPRVVLSCCVTRRPCCAGARQKKSKFVEIPRAERTVRPEPRVSHPADQVFACGRLPPAPRPAPGFTGAVILTGVLCLCAPRASGETFALLTFLCNMPGSVHIIADGGGKAAAHVGRSELGICSRVPRSHQMQLQMHGRRVQQRR